MQNVFPFRKEVQYYDLLLGYIPTARNHVENSKFTEMDEYFIKMAREELINN
jgi:hypothetical protein